MNKLKAEERKRDLRRTPSSSFYSSDFLFNIQNDVQFMQQYAYIDSTASQRRKTTTTNSDMKNIYENKIVI